MIILPRTYATVPKKILIYVAGIITGVILTFGVLAVIAANNNQGEDDIAYFETPINYENKKSTSFKVFQVLGNAALASEVSDKEQKLFLGNTVVILGQDFYSDQIVTINNPQRVGTYSYTNKGGMPMTVPVINGEFCE